MKEIERTRSIRLLPELRGSFLRAIQSLRSPKDQKNTSTPANETELNRLKRIYGVSSAPKTSLGNENEKSSSKKQPLQSVLASLELVNQAVQLNALVPEGFPLQTVQERMQIFILEIEKLNKLQTAEIIDRNLLEKLLQGFQKACREEAKASDWKKILEPLESVKARLEKLLD